MSPARQQAIKAAKYEERLEQVQLLQSMGYSLSAVAQAIRVDRRAVQRDLRELHNRHMLENADSLTERIDVSLQRKLLT